MKSVNCIVKWAGDREYPNQFKPGQMQQCVTFEDALAPTVVYKKYYPTGSAPWGLMRKGDRVTVILDDNGRITGVVDNDTNQTEIPSTPSTTPAKTTYSQTRQLVIKEDEICLHAKIIADTVDNLNTELALLGIGDFRPEDIRAMALTIYINLMKPHDEIVYKKIELPNPEGDDVDVEF